MKHVFIDTNIFLHFQTFDSIDWLTETGSDECTLVITGVIIKELDEKKNGTGKKATRARKVLKQIEAHEERPISLPKNVKLKICYQYPSESTITENRLSATHADQQQLASMIEYRELNEATQIYLCTNDVGARLRAKKHNFGSITLNDKYELPSELSELEQENQRLRQEVLKLEARTPKLKLSFNENSEVCKLEKPASFKEYDIFRSGQLRKLFTDHPEFDENRVTPRDEWAAAAFMAALVSEEDRAIYAEDKRHFLAEYETYMLKLYEFEKQQACTFQMQLELTNCGTVPAEVIEIRLTFPDDVRLVVLKDEIAPVPPDIPTKPKNIFENIASESILPLVSKHRFSAINLAPEKPNISLEVDDEQTYEASYVIRSLKHGEVFKLKLDDLGVRFFSEENLRNFNLSYFVGADNTPKHIEGKLNVSFE